MSAAARASKKWIWLGATLAVGGAGYLLYYGPGQKLTFETKKSGGASQTHLAPDALDPNAFRSFKLSDIKQYNHNTNVFTFDFDNPTAKYNGKTASCVLFKADIDGKEVVRPYTPVSRPNTIGHLDFVIKNYPKGIMSKHVHGMKKGEIIEIKGPIPKYPYEPNKFENLVLIAGGTGITPMIQVIEEVLFNPNDKTKITFLFANVSLDDILLKEHLDKLTEKYPDRFKVHYIVDKVTKNEAKIWQGEVGYITAKMFKKLSPMPAKKDDENLLVMVCGPPGFMKLLSGEKTKDFKQKRALMSKNFSTRTHSFRKPIKPIIDTDEDEDDKRRNPSGRKRVDVIQCLLESSSDENDDINLINQNPNNILWLTFAEICHIRSVLAQTVLSTRMFNTDKQYFKIFHNDLCFQCQEKINLLSLIPSFFYSKNYSTCYICQQKICRKCSLTNFLPPSSKHLFPVRMQTLIKLSSTSIENETNKNTELNPKAKTICYSCSQVILQSQ
ncbi:unnamed protein product [Rotaria sp. Silwood2]|nr:unnamed protein product [Rotaria sp. Silwood2]